MDTMKSRKSDKFIDLTEVVIILGAAATLAFITWREHL